MPFKPSRLNRTEDFIEVPGGKITKRPKKHSGIQYKSEKELKAKQPQPENTPFDKQEAMNQAYTSLNQSQSDIEKKEVLKNDSGGFIYRETSEPGEEEKFILGPDGRQTRTLTESQAKKEKTENYKLKHPEQYTK